MENPTIAHSTPPTPLIALMKGRDEEDRLLVSSLFLALDEPLKDILVGTGTVATIMRWVEAGILPPTHTEAVSKMIGILSLEDTLQMNQIPSVLVSLGIDSKNAQTLSSEIEKLVQPILAQKVLDEMPDMSGAQLPPLTQRIGAAPQPPSPGLQRPPNTVVDLRNKPQT